MIMSRYTEQVILAASDISYWLISAKEDSFLNIKYSVFPGSLLDIGKWDGVPPRAPPVPQGDAL